MEEDSQDTETDSENNVKNKRRNKNKTKYEMLFVHTKRPNKGNLWELEDKFEDVQSHYLLAIPYRSLSGNHADGHWSQPTSFTYPLGIGPVVDASYQGPKQQAGVQ